MALKLPVLNISSTELERQIAGVTKMEFRIVFRILEILAFSIPGFSIPIHRFLSRIPHSLLW
jgi:hypothetical protein